MANIFERSRRHISEKIAQWDQRRGLVNKVDAWFAVRMRTQMEYLKAGIPQALDEIGREFNIREIPFEGPLSDWFTNPKTKAHERSEKFIWDSEPFLGGFGQKELNLITAHDGGISIQMSYPTGRWMKHMEVWLYQQDYYPSDWENAGRPQPFVATLDGMSPAEIAIFAVDWAKPIIYADPLRVKPQDDGLTGGIVRV